MARRVRFLPPSHACLSNSRIVKCSRSAAKLLPHEFPRKRGGVGHLKTCPECTDKTTAQRNKKKGPLKSDVDLPPRPAPLQEQVTWTSCLKRLHDFSGQPVSLDVFIRVQELGLDLNDVGDEGTVADREQSEGIGKEELVGKLIAKHIAGKVYDATGYRLM